MKSVEIANNSKDTQVLYLKKKSLVVSAKSVLRVDVTNDEATELQEKCGGLVKLKMVDDGDKQEPENKIAKPNKTK